MIKHFPYSFLQSHIMCNRAHKYYFGAQIHSGSFTDSPMNQNTNERLNQTCEEYDIGKK